MMVNLSALGSKLSRYLVQHAQTVAEVSGATRIPDRPYTADTGSQCDCHIPSYLFNLVHIESTKATLSSETFTLA